MARTNLSNNACRMPARLNTKLAEHDAALDAIAGDDVTTTALAEQISTTGTAISVVLPHTEIAITGTVTYAIAAGTKKGQRKTITVISAGGTPNLTITGNFLLNGVAKTSIAHGGGGAAAGDGVELSWDSANTKWQIVRQFGTLTIS